MTEGKLNPRVKALRKQIHEFWPEFEYPNAEGGAALELAQKMFPIAHESTAVLAERYAP